eukprot:m51a1_g3483 hypothetical protein (84) ;mRNA; f:779449-779762
MSGKDGWNSEGADRPVKCQLCGDDMFGDLCSKCGASGVASEPIKGDTLGGGIGGNMYELGGVPLTIQSDQPFPNVHSDLETKH